MALQKIPKALQTEITGASLRTSANAAALYELLDSRRGPVKVKDVMAQLGIGLTEYRAARQLLTGTSAEVYVTQEGVVLKKHLTEDEQRHWHLAWSLGLFEASGEQLVLDEDLLEQVPVALVKLLTEGKLREHNRLNALRTKAQKTIGTLLKVVDMYRQVDKALGVALLPKVSGKDWKGAMKEVKAQLRTLPPGR
jgi:hypothetical protein